MKWLITFLIVIILGAGGYLLAAYMTGGALPTFGIVLGGERGEVREVVLKFWEDLKFNDPRSASKLLLPARQDIALVNNFLSQTFHGNPESLDVTGFEIVEIEIDSTGRRARAKSKVLANLLTENRPIQIETMFFLRKVKSKWYLDLSGSN